MSSNEHKSNLISCCTPVSMGSDDFIAAARRSGKRTKQAAENPKHLGQIDRPPAAK
jgi:hypothetical protein